MRLRCYCCGEPIGSDVALVSGQQTTDRVFVMLPEHMDRVGEEYSIMRVRRTAA